MHSGHALGLAIDVAQRACRSGFSSDGATGPFAGGIGSFVFGYTSVACVCNSVAFSAYAAGLLAARGRAIFGWFWAGWRLAARGRPYPPNPGFSAAAVFVYFEISCFLDCLYTLRSAFEIAKIRFGVTAVLFFSAVQQYPGQGGKIKPSR